MITENEVTEEITYKTLKYEGNIGLGHSAGRIGEGEQSSEQERVRSENENADLACYVCQFCGKTMTACDCRNE